MAFNRTVNEIMRGQWFLNVHSIHEYMTLAEKYLSGTAQIPDVAKEHPVSFLSEATGQEISRGEAKEETEPITAIVSMVGPMMKYGDCCSYGAVDYARMLDSLNNDDDVKAIVIRIDGPGGSTAAIAPFVDFASRKKKPIVVIADSAYSLHYWISVSLADHIMAENKISSGFGSIGVMASFIDVKGMYEQKGATVHEINSNLSEHKNETFRLALEGKYDKIKTEGLDPLAVKFQDAVKAGRPSLKQETGVLTGATFYSERALELGMIDSIGNLSKAIQLANALAEVNEL